MNFLYITNYINLFKLLLLFIIIIKYLKITFYYKYFIKYFKYEIIINNTLFPYNNLSKCHITLLKNFLLTI